MSNPKRLIVCCDGTWNDLEMEHPTNVVNLAQSIEAFGADGRPQVVYYDEGVGTGDGLDKYIGGAFGKGIDKNIRDAYRFLVLNYEKGDDVFLFGFSRGAYTVRSLAGMIGWSGLLSRDQLREAPEAYRIYRQHARRKTDRKERNRFFKKTLGAVPVHVLGCWDTVGALGIPDKIPWLPIDSWVNKDYRFHDTYLGAHVRVGLHATAIDERRREFQATRMEPSKPRVQKQVVKQVWFSGDHGCVGGGTFCKRGLSNIAFRWLIDETQKRHPGFAVDLNRLPEGAPTDPRIYFDRSIGALYRSKPRKVDAAQAEIHPSAIQRWHHCPWDRPKNIKNFSPAPASNSSALLKSPTRLKKGKSAEFVVFADVGPQDSRESKKRPGKNRSRILLKKSARYRFEVSPVQVWKDGRLDPCGPNGWSLKNVHELARPEDLNRFNGYLVKKAESKRLMPGAAWFELVGAIRGSDKGPFRIGDSSRLKNGYQPGADGELVAYANDLPSRFDVLDKYDNNEGWIWVKVTRLDEE